MSWAEALPMWLILAAFAGGAWYAWRWWTDPIRRNPDLCEDCGYDLHATPARCPECGRINPRHARFTQLERLRTNWPDKEVSVRTPAPGEGEIVVREGDDRMLLNLLAQHLEARGIGCRVTDPPLISSVGEGRPEAYGTHKLVVWAGDGERAVDIIRDLIGDVEA